MEIPVELTDRLFDEIRREFDERRSYAPRCFVFGRRHPLTGESMALLVVVHPPAGGAPTAELVREVSDAVDRTDALGFMMVASVRDGTSEQIVCALQCACCGEHASWTASVDRASGEPKLGKFNRDPSEDLAELN